MADNTLREYLFNLDWRPSGVTEDSEVTLASAVRGAGIQATLIVDAMLALGAWLERALAGMGRFHEAMFYAATRDRAGIANMQAFDKTVANMGGTAETAQKSIERFSHNLRANPSSFYGLLEGLGVRTRGRDGKLRDSVDLLRDLGAQFAAMPYQKRLQFAQLFGIDEQTMRAIADPEFGKGVERYKAIISAGGFNVDDAAKAWVEFDNMVRDLFTVLGLLEEKIETELIDKFQPAFGAMTQYLITNSDAITDTLAGVIDAIVATVKSFVGSTIASGKLWAGVREFFYEVARIIDWFYVHVTALIETVYRKTTDFTRGADYIRAHPLEAMALLARMAAEELGIVDSARASEAPGGPGVPSLFDFGEGGGGGGGKPGSLYGSNKDAPEANSPYAGHGTTNLTGLAVAQRLAAHLMTKYGLTREQALGAVGVMHYESGGFKGAMQEGAPTIAGSRGGKGFAQWTGPRRVAFETWAARNQLDLNSYEANEGFLDYELATNYSRTIPAIKQTNSARDAARSFEENYEGMREGGPGIPAFAQHQQRAEQLSQKLPADLSSFDVGPSTTSTPAPILATVPPVVSTPPAVTSTAPTAKVPTWVDVEKDNASGTDQIKKWEKALPDVKGGDGKVSQLQGAAAVRVAMIVVKKEYDRVSHVQIRRATSVADAAKQIARHQSGVNSELGQVVGEHLNG